MTDLNRFLLNPEKAVLLIIDIQEKLSTAMPESIFPRMRDTVSMLAFASELLKIPILTTEQYPKGIGHTVPELLDVSRRGLVVEKVSFGCSDEPEFVAALKATNRSQVIVTGMEAHVCVYLTILGLLQAGYHAYLVKDGVCSRHKTDYLSGLEAAQQAGATLVSAEMVLFQMMKQSTHPEFRTISKLIKGRA